MIALPGRVTLVRRTMKTPVMITGTESPSGGMYAVAEVSAHAPDDEMDVAAIERCGPYEVLGKIGAGGTGVVLEAYDPALRRKVALKLLRPKRRRSATHGAKRLAAEAQAMAQLSHPNAVTVFEIGHADDQVYIAMELVVGTTLRGWLKERPRGWREIVDMFAGAGRGLAAAHGAGLVHRDFKPENVLIGRDGRPRVCDFGLVTPSPERTDLDEVLASDRDDVFTSRLIGTPVYMSAEQWTGQTVDACTDQFAFCVALWEALCGSRPFPGRLLREVRAAVCAGAIAEPTLTRRSPRWLLAALRRGLAADPRMRWPNMPSLLDAIEQRTRSRRRWAIAATVTGVAVLSAAITWAAAGRRGAGDPCGPPTARLATVWGSAQRDAMRTHLVAIDPVQGAGRYRTIERALDAGARGWSDMHVAACRATRVDGRQSDTLLDLRMQCLDHWLLELGDTVAVVAQATGPTEVDQAVRAATSLSPIDVCAEARALAAAPLPTSAVDRATAIQLVNRTRELEVAERARRIEGLAARASELVAAARKLGHAPTLVSSLVVQIKILRAIGDHGGAEPPTRELIALATSLHDDRNEAMAWMGLIGTLMYSKGRADEALALVSSAGLAVLRAGDPVDLRAELLLHHALALNTVARPKDALALLDEARQLLERAGAATPGSSLARPLGETLDAIAWSYNCSGDFDGAIAASRKSFEHWRAVSGPDSVDLALPLINVAEALLRTHHNAEALDAIREVVRLREARSSNSPALAMALSGVGEVLTALERWDDALSAYERSLRIARATMTPGDLNVCMPLLEHGKLLLRLGRLDEAQRDFGEVVALFDKVGGKGANLAIALHGRANVAARRGRCADALVDDARAIKVLDDIEPASSLLLDPLTGIGACLVRLGRPAEAIPLLERAVAIQSSTDSFEQAKAKAYLGRARVEIRRDVAGGLAMARSARAGIAATSDGGDELRALDRWLAAHAR